jgi:hypothetical protein
MRCEEALFITNGMSVPSIFFTILLVHHNQKFFNFFFFQYNSFFFFLVDIYVNTTMKWTSWQCLASSERVAPRAVLEVVEQVAISRDSRGTGRDMGPCEQHPLRDES